MVEKSHIDDNLEAKSFERRTLMDLVVETVAKCAEEYDDGVHIQVRGSTTQLNTSLGSWSFIISCYISELRSS